MPPRLQRYYGSGYLHFLTTSCYQRRPILETLQTRDLFLQVVKEQLKAELTIRNIA